MFRKAVLLFIAAILALAGNVVSTRSSEAMVVPVFPEGVRAPRGDGEFIYYLKTGNMIKGDKIRVTLNGEDMSRRRDGIWYLVTERPNRRHVFNMDMWTSTEKWSAWIKFKKVWR